MNWFKRYLGKKNWENIASGTCKTKRQSTHITYTCVESDVPTWWYIDVDKERNIYRCYMTDGDIKQSLDVRILVSELSYLRPILDENGIKYV